MSIAKSSFRFTVGTFFSRITGLIRDRIVLSVFGASVYHDAFVVAFKIPNLFREMLAEGALGSSFTQVYGFVFEEDEEKAHQLFIDTLLIMSLVSAGVCLLGIFGAYYIVHLVAMLKKQGAVTDIFFANAIGLTRVLFPYLGLSVISAILMGALHQSGRFFTSAFSPVINNIGYIIGAWTIADWLSGHSAEVIEKYIANPRITGLALGVILGGIFQALYQLWGLWKPLISKIKSYTWHFPWSKDVKKICVLMFPMVIAASAGQINIVINLAFANSLEEGAVTWLNYAFRLVQLPIGLFSVAIGVVVLPALVRSIAAAGKKVDEKASSEIQNAVELVLWLVVPCLIFLLPNNLSIIQLLYQSGKFSAVDSLATGKALYAYSFMLIGYGLTKVLLPFYYATNRTSYAMRASLLGVGVNFLCNYLLVKRFGHQGLAFTASITVTFNSLILVFGLRHEKLTIKWQRLIETLILLFVGSILFLFAQYFLLGIFNQIVWFSTLPMIAAASIKILAGGAIVVIGFSLFAMIRLRITPGKFVKRFILKK